LRPNWRALFGIYYSGALALIVLGAVLWATGHGTGDPYLTVGVALALVPLVVIWLRKWLGRG
jgi:hypothetical protein